MNQTKTYLLAFFILCLTNSCFATSRVLVSIAPYRYFVEKIGGDTVDVTVLIPPGSSPHFYEPTAKHALKAAKSDLWFRIGDPFENKALHAVKNANPNMEIVDLREGLELISVNHSHTDHQHCGHHSCQDPHFWLSPRMIKRQARTIADRLTERYPENQELYRRNLNELIIDLDNLDREIKKTLLPYANRIILVSHPAFGYFSQDYQLIQKSIEFEGKDPTPRQLTKVLREAKQDRINTVFIVAQHPAKGARLIANQIDANIVILDPLAENYLNNMRKIALKIATHLKTDQ